MVLLTQVVLPNANLDTTAGLTPTSIICVLAFGCFIWRQKWAKNPVLPLDVFSSPLFSCSLIAQACMAFARANVTFILIFFFQGPFDQTPLQAGVSMIPFGVGALITAMIAGPVADKIGVRIPWMAGSAATLAGVIALGFITPEYNYWSIAGIMFVAGLGIGFANPPTSAALMSAVQPKRRATAGSLSAVATLAPQMTGIVMVFQLVLGSLPYEQIFNLFVYGTPVTGDAVHIFLNGVQSSCWATAAAVFVSLCMGLSVPKGHRTNATSAAAKAAPTPIAAVVIPSEPTVTMSVISAFESKPHLDIVVEKIPTQAAPHAAA
jgi:MFS family permease